MISKNTNKIIETLGAHPFLWTGSVCFILQTLFYCSLSRISMNVPAIIAIAVTIAAAVYWKGRLDVGKLSHGQFRMMIPISAAGGAVTAAVFTMCPYKSTLAMAAGCIVLALFYVNADFSKYKQQLNSLLIMGAGFMLKFYYVLDTDIYTRQNDVGRFGGSSGHTGYIEYILNNCHYPDFDGRDVWQFCHPPLHHTISAVWIYINEAFFMLDYDTSRECLQTLSLFYAMCVMILAYKILRHFNINGIALYTALLLVNFHPSFVILSGSINNDVLSVAFIMGAVLCTLKWYRSQTVGNILKIALCIGLGMMTKLSAALVAPPVAVIFLIAFIGGIKKRAAELIKQFALFGAVCIPIGLWYPVRNLIRFGIPLTYVHELSEKSGQYIGDQSFISRITDFSPKQFSNVFEQWAAWEDGVIVSGYNEYNPLTALLKTSVFGEYINEGCFQGKDFMYVFCAMLFWIGAVIAAVSFASVIICHTVRPKSENFTDKLLLGLLHLMMLGNFYKMSYDYPFTCTMNFRYITPTVIVGAAFLGLLIQRLDPGRKQSGKAAAVAAFGLSAIFAVLSSAMFIVLL